MPGLIALIEGRAHMSMISSSLSSEVDQLKKVMPGMSYDRLQAHPVLNTRISIAIHNTNTVRKASLNQIRKMMRRPDSPTGRSSAARTSRFALSWSAAAAV